MIPPADDASKDFSSPSHWFPDRLHADIHRTVGGCLNLLREFARISQELDPSVPSEWLMKRAQFFAYELQSHLDQGAVETSPRDRLAALNRYFFDEKRFECVTDVRRLLDPLEAYTLSRVLVSRSGAASVLAVVYGYLAERIGVHLEFVDLKPTCFLKWTDQGRARYIDIGRAGATLSSDELIEMLHSRFQLATFSNASLLENDTFENRMCDYVTEIKTAGARHLEPDVLLFLQNVLISYQSSNLQLLAERALLHRRLGHFKSALTDLKRYFAFHDREKSQPELVRVFDEITSILDQRKSELSPGDF